MLLERYISIRHFPDTAPQADHTHADIAYHAVSLMVANSTLLNKSYLNSFFHDVWVNINSNEMLDLNPSLDLLQQSGFTRSKVNHSLDFFLIDEIEDH